MLCSSLRAPILLSDGRITTCTKDHTGINVLADINSDNFETAMQKYKAERTLVSENPSHLPLCGNCHKNIARWGETGLPRAGWIQTDFSDADKRNFESAFDPDAITMNIELASRCNIRCIGCPISDGKAFHDTRASALLDVSKLMGWIGENARKIARVRLYHIGETFVHPQWIELCRFLKTQNPNIILMTSTNGMPLSKPRNFDGVRESGIDEIMFSIHGTSNDSCQKYMGQAFSFETALDGMRRVAGLRKDYGLKLKLLWRYLLFEWNDTAQEIATAQRIACEIGIDELHFTLTGGPSPSQRVRVGSDAWQAMRAQFAAASQVSADYQAVTPMVAMFRPNPAASERRSGYLPFIETSAGSSGSAPWRPLSATNAQKAALHVALGKAALDSGKFSDAVAAFEKAKSTHADQPAWIHGALGRAYAGLQQPADSSRAFAAALELASHTETYSLYLGQARALRKLSRWSEAAGAYKQALAIANRDSTYAEDLFPEYIDVLEKAGDGAEARRMRTARIEAVFLVNHDRRIIYCPVPKNACTTFKRILIENSSNAAMFQDSKSSPHVFSRSEKANMRLKNTSLLLDPRYTKVALLRNPFSRVVSAYANLFVEPLKWGHPLEQVVKNVINEVHVAQGLHPDWQLSITFEEFVGYIGRTPDPSLDYHWRSQTAVIGMALNGFDVIGSVEDLSSTLAVLERTNGLHAEPRRLNGTTYHARANVESPHTMLPADLARLDRFPSIEEMYTAKLHSAVARRYSEDIHLYSRYFDLADGHAIGHPDATSSKLSMSLSASA
ncbi:MAG: sulfotransferase family 2 domain-containing protein [Hyphomicrobium sp.]|nr:sulfotransferase family 2 domain-containing protein [Hyphomicrobium sp.]